MTATRPTTDTVIDREPVDTVLLDLVRRLDLEPSPAGMYRLLDEGIDRLVGFDRIAIGRLNATTRRMTITHERGLSLGYPDRYETLPADQHSLIHPVVEHGRSILHTVPPDHDIYRGDVNRRRHGIRQALVTPIVANGVVTGLITLNSASADQYSPASVTAVEACSRLLGLALAVRESSPRAGEAVHAREAFAETLARIALAETVDEVLAHLYQGIKATTGASILRFSRTSHGTYAFEEARAGSPGTAGVETAGFGLADRLPGLIDADVGFGSIPQRAVFTNLPIGDQAIVRVRELDALDDLINDVTAVAITPLHAAREILGALVAVWPPSAPSERLPDHIRSLFSFGDLAGPAIHRLILLQRLQQRIAEIDTIRRLTDSIARTPRFQDGLDIICRTSQLITGFDFVAIAETATDHVLWRSASGARDQSFVNRRLPVPRRVLSRILQSHQEVILADVRRDPEFTPDLMPVHMAEGLRSTAIIPVYVNARLRAAMVFASRRLHTFTSEELNILHSLAATVATAIASNDARMRDMSHT